MHYWALLLALIGVVLGVAAIILAGMDDSPGGQLVGVGLVGGAVFFGWRRMHRATR